MRYISGNACRTGALPTTLTLREHVYAWRFAFTTGGLGTGLGALLAVLFMFLLSLVSVFVGRHDIADGSVQGFLNAFILSVSSILSIYTPLVMVVGAVVGGILGAINGVVMETVAHFFRHPANERIYRLAMLVTSMVTTFVGAFVLFYSLLSHYAVDRRVDLNFLLSISIIAAIASGYASQHVAGWYLKQQKAKPEN
jgi:hypothetical protein